MDALDVVAVLANEFSHVPVMLVVRSVKRSVDEHPDAGAELVLDSARAMLRSVEGEWLV